MKTIHYKGFLDSSSMHSKAPWGNKTKFGGYMVAIWSNVLKHMWVGTQS